MFILIAAAAMMPNPAQAAEPAQERRAPQTIPVDHPVGVEASRLARSIMSGGMRLPVTYTDRDLAVMGTVVSVRHRTGMDEAVLTTNGSADRLTARIAPSDKLKTGERVGLACRKVSGNATTAVVARCRLVSAPGLAPATMTLTPVR